MHAVPSVPDWQITTNVTENEVLQTEPVPQLLGGREESGRRAGTGRAAVRAKPGTVQKVLFKPGMSGYARELCCFNMDF